jgi:hypothetical protein
MMPEFNGQKSLILKNISKFIFQKIKKDFNAKRFKLFIKLSIKVYVKHLIFSRSLTQGEIFQKSSSTFSKFFQTIS